MPALKLIPAPPGACVFQGFAFLRELAGSRDRHALDTRFLEPGLRLGRVDAAIPGHGARRMVKERDVMCHGLGSLPMLIGMLQDLIARHDASLDFIEDD